MGSPKEQLHSLLPNGKILDICLQVIRCYTLGDHFISQNGLFQPEAAIFRCDRRSQHYGSHRDAIRDWRPPQFVVVKGKTLGSHIKRP